MGGSSKALGVAVAFSVKPGHTLTQAWVTVGGGCESLLVPGLFEELALLGSPGTQDGPPQGSPAAQ